MYRNRLAGKVGPGRNWGQPPNRDPLSRTAAAQSRRPHRTRPLDEAQRRQQAGDVTRLLHQLAEGDAEALDGLVPLVYRELHAIAHNQMAGEAPGHTLNTTAVVHEAYIKLAGLNRIDWQDRTHFFAVASQAVRRVLVDYAVRRKALKRGGDRKRVDLTDGALFQDDDSGTILALNQALERLEALDPRQARVVECRFFGGMSVDETATALGISTATVKRDWAVARAWLNRELSDG